MTGEYGTVLGVWAHPDDSQVEPMTAMLGRQILFDSQDGEYFRLAARKDPV